MTIRQNIAFSMAEIGEYKDYTSIRPFDPKYLKTVAFEAKIRPLG